MKKRSKLLAVVCATALSMSCVTPVFACTPKLNTPSVHIPEITVKFDEKMEKAFEEAAKKFIEKNVLEKPTIQSAYYFNKTLRYGTYSCLNVRWDEVEDATSYEVKVTKSDGTEKVFSTSYPALIMSNYSDDFVSSGMDDAVVKVKAYGEDETFSLWSDEATVSRFDF